MYIINNIGPEIDPWEIPLEIKRKKEVIVGRTLNKYIKCLLYI